MLLDCIVTSDDTQCHHNKSNSKQHSIQWHYKREMSETAFIKKPDFSLMRKGSCSVCMLLVRLDHNNELTVRTPPPHLSVTHCKAVGMPLSAFSKDTSYMLLACCARGG